MKNDIEPDPDPEVNSQREPIMDLIEDENSICVTVELPGVEKKNIELIVDRKTLTLTATEATRQYHKELTLSSVVDPESAEATYKNGVLDVVLKKEQKSEVQKAKDIDIRAEVALKNIINEKDQIIETLKTELETQSDLAEDYLNKLQRLQSDFQNYKQRIATEREQDVDKAKEELILRTIEVIDNFERALESSKHAKGNKALMKGVEMIHKQLLDILKFECVEPIDAVGKQFDPEQHEIVFKEFKDEIPEDTILEEFQKGYMYKSKLIRPARVKVVKKKSDENKDQE
jgi:molecular chaperone GrpE